MGNSFRRLAILVFALNLGMTAPQQAKSQTAFSVTSPPWLMVSPAANRVRPISGLALVNRIDSGAVGKGVSLPRWHRVQRGESISAIACAWGTVPQAIVRANGIRDPNLLLAGDLIYVPAPQPIDVSMLTVRKGDTLSSLAKRHGLSPDGLKRLNGIPADADNLYEGQQIVVPATVIEYKPIEYNPVVSRAVRPVANSASIHAAGAAMAFLWPVNGKLTSPFGWRSGRMHYGIDLAAPTGTPIQAAAGGKVTFAGWKSGYGMLVIIDHDKGWKTYYAHNNKLYVVVGDWVAQGQHIADVGSTGRATGSHLHFEIHHGSQRINPHFYLGKR